MSDVQLIQKLISKKTGVNSYKMRSGNLVDDDWEKIAEGIGELCDLPIRIITKAFNIQQIEKTIRKLKNKNDYSLYTGISDLDDKILGLHNGELTIIGARPRCR